MDTEITTNIPALTEAAGDVRPTSVENLLLLARIFDLDINNFTLFNIFWKFLFLDINHNINKS